MDKLVMAAAEGVLKEWGHWVIRDEWERHAARLRASYSEIEGLYQAVEPLAEAFLLELSKYTELPAEGDVVERLFYLMLTMAEVAQPVEMYKQVLVPRGFDPWRLKPIPEVNASYRPARLGI